MKELKKAHANNLWKVRIKDGGAKRTVVVKATFEQMEYQYLHNPNWSDYSPLDFYRLPKSAPSA